MLWCHGAQDTGLCDEIRAKVHYDHNACPSQTDRQTDRQTDGQTDERSGNSATIRSDERIAR